MSVSAFIRRWFSRLHDWDRKCAYCGKYSSDPMVVISHGPQGLLLAHRACRDEDVAA